jgi:predicted RNA-binding Zn ribbon-like protein
MSDREPAPGCLRLLEEFVNTLDIETSEDAISLPDGLTSWLGACGYSPSTDVRRAAAAREGLRALQAAIDALNASLAPVSVCLEPAGARLSASGDGLDALLADISQAAVEAMADGSWSRLKVCRDEDCRWAFYDRSKNRSGAWCTMAVCGSRTKVRAYRERQAGRA